MGAIRRGQRQLVQRQRRRAACVVPSRAGHLAARDLGHPRGTALRPAGARAAGVGGHAVKDQHHAGEVRARAAPVDGIQ